MGPLSRDHLGCDGPTDLTSRLVRYEVGRPRYRQMSSALRPGFEFSLTILRGGQLEHRLVSSKVPWEHAPHRSDTSSWFRADRIRQNRLGWIRGPTGLTSCSDRNFLR